MKGSACRSRALSARVGCRGLLSAGEQGTGQRIRRSQRPLHRRRSHGSARNPKVQTIALITARGYFNNQKPPALARRDQVRTSLGHTRPALLFSGRRKTISPRVQRNGGLQKQMHWTSTEMELAANFLLRLRGANTVCRLPLHGCPHSLCHGASLLRCLLPGFSVCQHHGCTWVTETRRLTWGQD